MHNSSLNETDRRGRSILIQACKTNNYNLVLSLLELGHNANQKDSSNLTGLSHAVKRLFGQSIALMLEHGCNATEDEMKKITKSTFPRIDFHPFVIACEKEYTRALKRMFSFGMRSDVVECGFSAARSKNVLSAFMDCGYNIKKLYKSGHGTALHSAVSYGDLDSIDFLLEMGLDVDYESESCSSPLLSCILNCPEERKRAAMKLLIDSGCKISIENDMVQALLKDNFNERNRCLRVLNEIGWDYIWVEEHLLDFLYRKIQNFAVDDREGF